MKPYTMLQSFQKHFGVGACRGMERWWLLLAVLVIMFNVTHQYTTLGTMSKWSSGQTITGSSIRTVQVRTKMECALHCMTDEGCQAVAVYCSSSQTAGSFDCELNYSSYTIVHNSDMCYSVVQTRNEFVNGVTVNDLTTIAPFPDLTTIASFPAGTASSQGSIRGGIGNLLNMCSSLSSTDIAIITDDGVYIYDNKDALLTGACLGPLTLTSIFNGYSGSGALPSISDIIGLMVYQNNDIDMYNNFQVWRWQVQSGNLWSQSAQSFPKPMENLLGVSTGDLPPSNSDWCVNRDRNGRQDRFFYNGGLLYYFSTQNPTQDTFTPSATDKYMNGYNLNPWTNLPAEPLVAVFSITSDSDDFVMITQSGELYQYQMDHVTNSNNPPITSTHLGTLVF